MAEEKQPAFNVKLRIPVVALVLLAAIAGIYYFAVFLPAQNPGPVPENGAEGILAGKSGDYSPDGTNCHGVHNLEEASRNDFAAPAVVDINEANGNLLVRGPLPLIVRDGSDITKGCRNKSDWTFAYDNLNSMVRAEKDVAPVYFTQGKKTALNAQMQSFDLKEYRVIDISLLNTADNAEYFAVENATFGGMYSRCSKPIVDGTLRGQPANLIWSSVGACSDDGSCHNVVYSDGDVLCSYNNLMTEINTLMAEKDPSGKKRLLYVHCTHGADRTGIVTMGYLMKTVGLNFNDALLYTNNSGQQTSEHPHPVKDTYYTMAAYYCKAINGTGCPGSGSSGGSVPAIASGTPVPTVSPVLVASPQPSETTVAAQTPVPSRYNPVGSGDTHI